MFDQTHDCGCEHCCLPTIVQERDEAMARLSRACELLEKSWEPDETDTMDAIYHLESQVRAFLAGEVTK